MNNNKPNVTVNITGAFLIILITLKLAGAIDWPWYVVFAPIWLSILFVAIGALILFGLNVLQENEALIKKRLRKLIKKINRRNHKR